MSIHAKPITLAPAKPQPDHSRKLINAAFCGTVDKADLLHMARAILQLSDELHELRERLRGFEMAMRGKQ